MRSLSLAAITHGLNVQNGRSCLIPGAVRGGKQQLFVVAGFCGRELDDMHVYRWDRFNTCA